MSDDVGPLRQGYKTTCGTCGMELAHRDYIHLGILMEEHYQATGDDNYTSIKNYDYILEGVTPTIQELEDASKFKGLYPQPGEPQ